MGIPKEAANFLTRNARITKIMLKKGAKSSIYKRHMGAVRYGNLGFFMGTGAVVGGGYGLADNLLGEDRVSMLGGALSGAMKGGMAYGGRAMFRKGITARRGAIAAGKRWGGENISHYGGLIKGRRGRAGSFHMPDWV